MWEIWVASEDGYNEHDARWKPFFSRALAEEVVERVRRHWEEDLGEENVWPYVRKRRWRGG